MESENQTKSLLDTIPKRLNDLPSWTSAMRPSSSSKRVTTDMQGMRKEIHLIQADVDEPKTHTRDPLELGSAIAPAPLATPPLPKMG